MGKLTKIGIIAAFIAGLVLSPGCIPEAIAVGGDVVTVGAKELYAAYAKDETEADSLYKGRTLEVTGIVSLSRAIVMTDQYVIVLNSELEPTLNSWGVQCVFNTTRDARLYNAEKKRTVTVKGRCDGLQQDVVLRDCQLISLLSLTPTEQTGK